MKLNKRSLIKLSAIIIIAVLAISRVYRNYNQDETAPQAESAVNEIATQPASVGASYAEIAIISIAGAIVVILSIKKLRSDK